MAFEFASTTPPDNPPDNPAGEPITVLLEGQPIELIADAGSSLAFWLPVVVSLVIFVGGMFFQREQEKRAHERLIGVELRTRQLAALAELSSAATQVAQSGEHYIDATSPGFSEQDRDHYRNDFGSAVERLDDAISLVEILNTTAEIDQAKWSASALGALAIRVARDAADGQHLEEGTVVDLDGFEYVEPGPTLGTARFKLTIAIRNAVSLQ